MNTKELLTVEFRYSDAPHSGAESTFRSKTITIGIYGNIEDAVYEGNKILDILSNTYEVREKFKVKGLFGQPDRLVSNCCYPTKGIQYFANITSMEFSNIEDIISETLNAYTRYENYTEDED